MKKVTIEDKEYELIYKSSLCEVERLRLLCGIHANIIVEPVDANETFGESQMEVHFTYNGSNHSCFTSKSNWNRAIVHDTIDNCTLFLHPIGNRFHIMAIGIPIV